MAIDAHLREAILTRPEHVWTPAIDAAGHLRHGAEVCELTGWLDLHTWPEGDVPRRGVRAFRRAGQRRGVYAGMSWAGATSLVVGVSRAMEPSER